MRETTGGAVDKCSQTHVLTAWLREQGVDATSVAKDMLADMLIRDDLPEPARRALELRQEAAKTSTAKIEAMRSEEHTSELQSLMRISYAVFCLKKKKNIEN